MADLCPFLDEDLRVVNLGNWFFGRWVHECKMFELLWKSFIDNGVDETQLDFSVTPHQPMFDALDEFIREVVYREQQEINLFW